MSGISIEEIFKILIELHEDQKNVKLSYTLEYPDKEKEETPAKPA